MDEPKTVTNMAIRAAYEFSQSVLNKGRVGIDDRDLPMLDVFDCLTCDGVTSEKPFCPPVRRRAPVYGGLLLRQGKISGSRATV